MNALECLPCWPKLATLLISFCSDDGFFAPSILAKDKGRQGMEGEWFPKVRVHEPLEAWT